MRTPERGESLVEVLITLVILGIAVTALVSGLATASRTAGSQRYQADVSTYLVKAAEAVKAATYEGSCPVGHDQYRTTAAAQIPATWAAQGGSFTSLVEYWNPATGTFAAGACLDDAEATQQAQVVRPQVDGFTEIEASGEVPLTWRGLLVRFTNGPAAGESRTVISVDEAQDSFRVDPFVATPTNGNTFVVEHFRSAKRHRVTLTLTPPVGGPARLSVVKRQL